MPMFPVTDPEGKHYGTSSPFKILGICTSPYHRTCSGGFRQLHVLQIKSTIIRAFLDLSELAQGIPFYLPKQDDASAMDRVGDVRNVVLHRLLCLPKASNPQPSIFTNSDPSHNSHATAIAVYRACWLAAFIFSTHVTFPIPTTRGPREGLLPKLQAVLSMCYGDTDGADVSQIVLWCTVVGGVASEDGDPTRHRWFVVQFKRLCLSLGIQTWTRMQELMRSFAWMDIACDAGGYRLWTEFRSEDGFYLGKHTLPFRDQELYVSEHTEG
jgi:hypothetical protein